MNVKYQQSRFSRFAAWTAQITGRPIGLGLALISVIVWGASGPIFGFSDTWQLVINTGTTVVTFLMVFLIQHTQNRDSQALHVKLDELIRAHGNASNALLDLDHLDDRQLSRLREQYRKLAAIDRKLMDC